MTTYLPLLTFLAMAAIVSTFVISLFRRSRSRWGPAPARQAPASDAADFYSPSLTAMPSSESAAASADAGLLNCPGAGGSFDGGGASADSSAPSGDSSSCDSFDSGGSSLFD